MLPYHQSFMHSTSGTGTRSAFWAAMNPTRMRSSVRDGDGARGLHHLGEAAVTARSELHAVMAHALGDGKRFAAARGFWCRAVLACLLAVPQKSESRSAMLAKNATVHGNVGCQLVLCEGDVARLAALKRFAFGVQRLKVLKKRHG